MAHNIHCHTVIQPGRVPEKTIRSVLLQGYPKLRYIVIDGGSTDRSEEIIRHYEKELEYWVSEPDSGHSYAINKGLRENLEYGMDLDLWLKIAARCRIERADRQLAVALSHVGSTTGNAVTNEYALLGVFLLLADSGGGEEAREKVRRTRERISSPLYKYKKWLYGPNGRPLLSITGSCLWPCEISLTGFGENWTVERWMGSRQRTGPIRFVQLLNIC